MDLIWVKAEAKNFLKWDWTGGIILIRFNKFRRARKSERAQDASRDGGLRRSLSPQSQFPPNALPDGAWLIALAE